MALAISKVAILTADLRLAQAISEFEADLSTQQKARYHIYRGSLSRGSPPEPRDVMELTAEIDSQSLASSRGRRCFGPRFTNVLHAIQQFTTVGDVMVGGTQNILACGVWSLVRMTLLTLVNYSSYFEKLSELLMKVGRAAPVYDRLKLLFPRSKDLQSHLSEYFILVVQLCHRFLKMTQKSTLGQLVTFPSDSTLKPYELGLDQWAGSIREEVRLLMAEGSQGQGSRLKALMKSSEMEAHRRRLDSYVRLLDACSMYDYETTWKETRKLGAANWFRQAPEYQSWKARKDSCILLCTGTLGSGKSVVLANIIDDLYLHTRDTKVPIAYFFCRHDIFDSLSARTILGSLIRQLLCPTMNLAVVDGLIDAKLPLATVETLLQVFRKVVPSGYEAYIVLDGLDECSQSQRSELAQLLQQLQGLGSLRICVSFRPDVDIRSLLGPQPWSNIETMFVPEENPDVNHFIESELINCIESGRLALGDPTLAPEILQALTDGAQGMFLWVALQFHSLCAAKTDEAIRETLADLPKDLPETFSRILQKSVTRESEKSFQTRTFELVIAARRPLTAGELREALSVTPGNDVWDPSRLLNDVFSALACCGSLITVDEENSTVKLIHHSVKQFLLGNSRSLNSDSITIDSAGRTMRAILFTYLSYNVFETQVSTKLVSSVPVEHAPAKIVQATVSSSRSRDLALLLLKNRSRSKVDIGRVVAEASKQSQPRHEDEFLFYPYAKSFWFDHAWSISEQETATYVMLCNRIDRKLASSSSADEESQRILFWAARYGHPAIVELFCKHGADMQVQDDTLGTTPLFWAAANGREKVVKVLAAERNANLEFKDANGRTPLSYAAGLGFEGTVAILIDSGADIDSMDYQRRTPLFWAAHEGHAEVVKTLTANGAAVESETLYSVQTPLLCAIENKRAAVVEVLLQNGADPEKKIRNASALSFAIQNYAGSVEIIQSLVNHGADIEIRDYNDYNGETPLHLAARSGEEEVVALLLDKGADIEIRDYNGETPLHLAATSGREDIVALLLEKGANIENRNDFGKTPLSSVAGFPSTSYMARLERSHLSIIKELIAKGAEIDAKDQLGRTPLMSAVRQQGKGPIIKTLIEHGAKRDTLDYEGYSVFYDAVVSDFSGEMLKTLLDHGFGIEVRTAHGQTPLRLAAKHGNLSAVRMLLDHGADTRPSAMGFPITAGTEHPAIVALLKEADNRLYPPATYSSGEMVAVQSGGREMRLGYKSPRKQAHEHQELHLRRSEEFYGID